MHKPINELKVLVVEGNRHMRQLDQKLLEGMAIEDICVAFTDKEAFEDLNLNRFDLILTNHHAETFDGYQFVKKVRASDKAFIRDLPIILMIEDGSDDHIAQAKRAGATFVITKPFSAHTLYDHITNLTYKDGQLSHQEIAAWTGTD